MTATDGVLTGEQALFRSAVALMASTVATAALGMVYWVVAARVLSQEDVGRGSALVSTMVVLSTFAQLNLTGALVRFVPVSGRRTRRFVLSAYTVSAAAGVVLSIAAILVLANVSEQLAFIRDDRATALAFCAGVTLWTVFNLEDAVLTALRRASWVLGSNAAYAVVKLALLVPLASAGALGVLLSWVLPLPFVLVAVAVYVLGRAVPAHEAAARPEAAPPSRRVVARFVGVDYVGSVFTQGVPLVLPLLVVSTSGAEENALFYIAWVVAQGVLTLAGNVATSLTVEGAHDELQLSSLTRLVLRRLAVLGGPVVLVLVLAPGLLLTVFGSAYPEADGVLRLLALAAVPRALVMVFSAVARVRGHLWTLVAVEILAGVTTLLAATLLTPERGALGAALAWLLGQSLAGAAVLPYVVRQTRLTG